MLMALLVVLHVIVCVILVVFILLQAGKGHGLAGSSFGAEMNTVFGTHTATFMTKLTSAAAIIFLITCIAIDMTIAMRGRSLMANKPALTQEQIDTLMTKLKDAQAAKEGGDVAQATATDATQAVNEAAAPGVASAPEAVAPVVADAADAVKAAVAN